MYANGTGSAPLSTGDTQRPSPPHTNTFIFHLITNCLIFYLLLDSTRIKKAIVYPILVLTVVSLGISVGDGLDRTTSKIFLIQSIAMVFLCMLYSKQRLSKKPFISSSLPSAFWFCVSAAFYFGGKRFITGLVDTLLPHNMAIARSFYDAGYIFNDLYMLVLIGIALSQNLD
ncbi:hypothetical protein [Dyadobacter jejuensis]|uniref:hypothetical protein n=1 Tax=Dyadobacter jejuensis TaxID=1082580 RepID=UPI0011B1D348|nr:hypothetical protein [Dyadobacter jejuensis]